MRTTMKLYGATVPGGDYCRLKALADILVEQSRSDYPIGRARRLAVALAIDAVNAMRLATGVTS